MKRFLHTALAAVMSLQLTVWAGAVNAEETAESGVYTAPESPSVTYNMNLDWKFYDCKTMQDDITTAMSKVEQNGVPFYSPEFDDSAWETVSIPHGIGGGTNSFTKNIGDSGGGYRSVLLYRKTITIPSDAGQDIFRA